MKIDEKQISHVSTLARLSLTSEEKTEFAGQLSSIMDYVEKINKLNTDNVEPADHIVDVENVFRADEVHKSLERNDIEKIAPEFTNGHFVVPKIIDEA